MRRALLGSLLAFSSIAGCGLALDYDPPTDAGGGGFDVVQLLDAGACPMGCPEGEVCVSGTCRVPDVCRSSTDCPVAAVGECPSDCVSGACIPRPRRSCVAPDSWECAEIDSCVSCDPIVLPELCDTGETCDEAGGYRCIECTLEDTRNCDPSAPICGPDGRCAPCSSDRECGLTGLGHACVDGACVECADDVHCTDAAAPRCDTSIRSCVGCLTLADCPVGEVCVGGECSRCMDDGACGPGRRCVSGACERAVECATVGECPRNCVGEAITCALGFCVYPVPTLGAEICDDGVSCTTDTCSPRHPLADAFGCVFSPADAACSDGVPCTADRCAPDAPGSDTDGCVYRPVDLRCAPRLPGLTGCIAPVCVGEVPNADPDGCIDAFVRPCRDGQLCTRAGTCLDAPDCAACLDDGDACNGVERCEGGTCTQQFMGSCSGECGQYCVDVSSCAERPFDVGCGITTP